MVAYIMCLIRVLYDTSTYTHTLTYSCKRWGVAEVTKCGHVQPVSQLAFWTQLHLAGSRFFIYLCAAARCRPLARSPSPTPSPSPLSALYLSDCLARCFLLVFLSLSASRYKIKYLSLFFMANSLAETGKRAVERAMSVWAWTCAHVCMYNLAINRVPFQPDS